MEGIKFIIHIFGATGVAKKNTLINSTLNINFFHYTISIMFK